MLDIVRSDVTLLEKKQQDYANTEDQWKNFREAAEFVRKTRGVEFEALDGAYYLLGLKISRMKNLGKRDARNESRLDTLQDLRGYSAIIQAIEEEEAALTAAGGDMATVGIDKANFDRLVTELRSNAPEFGRACPNDADADDSIGLTDDEDDDDAPCMDYLDDEGITHEYVDEVVTTGTIGDVASLVHEIASEKGWWDDVTVGGGNMDTASIAEKLLMIHSEVSEATEELRVTAPNCLLDEKFENFDKPAGFAIELADILIRVLDLSAMMGIDIEDALVRKITYNNTRAYRHGGKRI